MASENDVDVLDIYSQVMPQNMAIPDDTKKQVKKAKSTSSKSKKAEDKKSKSLKKDNPKQKTRVSKKNETNDEFINKLNYLEKIIEKGIQKKSTGKKNVTPEKVVNHSKKNNNKKTSSKAKKNTKSKLKKAKKKNSSKPKKGKQAKKAIKVKKPKKAIKAKKKSPIKKEVLKYKDKKDGDGQDKKPKIITKKAKKNAADKPAEIKKETKSKAATKSPKATKASKPSKGKSQKNKNSESEEKFVRSANIYPPNPVIKHLELESKKNKAKPVTKKPTSTNYITKSNNISLITMSKFIANASLNRVYEYDNIDELEKLPVNEIAGYLNNKYKIYNNFPYSFKDIKIYLNNIYKGDITKLPKWNKKNISYSVNLASGNNVSSKVLSIINSHFSTIENYTKLRFNSLPANSFRGDIQIIYSDNLYKDAQEDGFREIFFPQFDKNLLPKYLEMYQKSIYTEKNKLKLYAVRLSSNMDLYKFYALEQNNEYSRDNVTHDSFKTVLNTVIARQKDDNFPTADNSIYKDTQIWNAGLSPLDQAFLTNLYKYDYIQLIPKDKAIEILALIIYNDLLSGKYRIPGVIFISKGKENE